MISLIRQSGTFISSSAPLAKPSEPPKQQKVYDIERILFFPIPEPVKVEPFFTITPPDPYQFPLHNTSLEGIQLVDSHFPDEINRKLENQLHTRIQRISRFQDKICALGRGRGLVLGDRYLDVHGASAYAYGPDYLVVAFQNCTLSIYTMDLKIFKEFPNFSKKKLTMIRILRVQRNFEGLILITSTGRDMIIHRLEKSFFSKLSIKLQKEILSNLPQPITHLLQIPLALQLLLYQDVSYQDTILMAAVCLDKVVVVRFANYRLTFDKFWDIIYDRKWTQDISVTSCSWGQAKITSTEKEIFGQRIVLTYSFGKNLYLAILNSNNQYLDGQTKIKYEWIESHPFSLEGNQSFVFCQFMKRNELMLVTDENRIVIFHTENAQLFDRPRSVYNTPCLTYKFEERLKGQRLENVKQTNKANIRQMSQQQMEDMPPEMLQLLRQVPIVTYAESFSHYYESLQVYFLTERHFGIYQYKNWKQICESLKTQQKYEAAMRFLIALYLKANRFELGIQHSQQSYNYDLSQYSKILAIEFLEKKLSNLIQMPQLLEKFNVGPLISIPVEFLVRMNEFAFLFEVLKGKIISYTSEDAFYRVLEPFAQHGRIKFIPEGQLRQVLRYYINKEDTDIVQRMAIHFDVSVIDRGIVIQQLIENHLVVSLAYVCTQGNEIQFLTPFAKYWSMSDNEKRKNNRQKAEFYARRALYYVKICLQRNMALKTYSYEKYASMIELLTNNFFTKRMLMGLMKIDMEGTLDSLSYYFSIEISGIVNESPKFKLADITMESWINQRQGNHNIELLLSGIYTYCSEQGMDLQEKKLFYLLLSRIIIYKTIKFTNEKYIDILSFLINNYSVIEKIKYGLDADQLQNYQQLCSQQEAMEILSSGYISKLLELVNQQFPLKKSLADLFQCSRRVPLTELQAHICLIQGNYKASIEIYLRGRQSSKQRVFEFLTDTFHNFNISKNKKEASKLMEILQQYVPNLITLSPAKSRDLIQQYMPSYQQQLIMGLQNQPAIQLDYLEHIIPNSNVSEKSTLRYIELMCKNKPTQLISSFKKYPHLPIQESLQICRKYEVFECMEFLYQRMGNIEESVKIAALRIDKLFLLRFNSVDIDEYTYYSQVAKILDNAIQTCINNKSQQIWSILLDSMIGIFNKYRQRIQFNQEIIVFYQINAKILHCMARYCSIDYLADIFDSRYNRLDMGGSMKKSFIDMLNNFSYSENILFSARSLNRDTYWQALYDRCQASYRAYLPLGWCQNCQQRIQRVTQAVCYPCKHTYHKQCVLNDNPYCLACLKTLQFQLEFYLSIPNPQKPPIKIDKLFLEAEKKELQMRQRFKIHDYEQLQRNKESQIAAVHLTNKLDRFKRFDTQIDLIQFTNNEVQKQLEISFKSQMNRAR